MLVRVVAAVGALVLVGAGVVLARAQLYEVPVPAAPSIVASPPQWADGTTTRTSPSPAAAADATPAALPSPQPAPVAVPEPPTTPEQRLQLRLARILGRSTTGGRVGLAVLDAEGHAIFGDAAGRPMIPASTQKLPVAAAALSRLGTDFRYVTTVHATALPDAAGVVDGDLVLVGGGDPTLAGPEFARIEPSRPLTPLAALARRIKRAGITRVRGRILGDPTIFADEPVAAGWLPRYFDHLDTTRSSGLTVDKGRRLFRKGGTLRAVPAEDPAHQAARSLRRLLRDRGVAVKGRAVALRASVPTATEVASIRSPAMGRLLRYMVQRSDNHLADAIFRTLGSAEGDSTWIGSAGAVATTLTPLQLDWDGVVLADGSGLSRANRVSPAFLAQLQSRMWRSNLREQWHRLLAVAAESGTLRYRFRDTVAAQRIFGKTGSLRDVVALVGTVVGPAERLLHFAFTGNRVGSTSDMRALTDRAVVAMAEELYECRRVRPPGRTKKGKRRASRLVCAAGG